VSSDTVSLLLIRTLVPPGVGERVVGDIKLSDHVRRAVLAAGGVPLIERSGHTFLKRRMIREDCLLGCEVSGHYFYRELGGGDDGMFSSLLMADMICQSGPLHALEATLPRLFVTPDLRVHEERVPYGVMVERLRDALRPAEETDIDGVRLEHAEGFVLARKSVTEPVVTLRLEGLDERSFERLLRRCSEALPELAQEFEQCLLTKEA
jgi:phosphomannomutase